MSRPLLILDFDGTLCLGDGPVRAYGAEVAREAGAAPELIAEALDAFLEASDAYGEMAGSPDGYTAVARWGRAVGVDDGGLSRAFLRSRPAVESGEVPVHAPDGIVELLDRWRAFDRVLVTNAPQEGTETLVHRLGLSGSLDAIIGDAAKPAGLQRLIGPGGAWDAAPRRTVISIGDIWVNDLEPVAAVGGVTGLIDRHHQAQATPTVRGESIQEVFEGLREWRDGALAVS